MDTNRKKKLITASTYIIASFCLLAFIAMGIVASLRAAFTVPEDAKYVPELTVPQTDVPKSMLPPAPENSEVFEPELIPETPPAAASGKSEAVQVPSYTLPVEGEIIKDFSGETLVFSQTMCDYRVHSGTDFACEYGDAVRSFSDGTVEAFFEDPLNGMTLVVKHNESLSTCYSNLSSELPEGIEVGSTVRTGDTVAFVGESGILECAEECHLHFEILQNGNRVGLSDFTAE